MNPSKSVITLLINGNITDAKNKAKNYSYWKLMTAAELLGYNIVEQVAIAGFLKGQVDFQKYCDTVNK